MSDAKDRAAYPRHQWMELFEKYCARLRPAFKATFASGEWYYLHGYKPWDAAHEVTGR